MTTEMKANPFNIPEPTPLPVYETPTFIDGDFIREEELVYPNGTMKMKFYQNTIYTETNNLKNSTPYLNPKLYMNEYGLYNDTINGWKIWNDFGIESYINTLTKEVIWVKKDYDTTPKRKVAKNKIWAVNPNAGTILHAFGFYTLDYYEKMARDEII